MADADLVVLMARLASDGCSLTTGEAISALAEMLESLRPTLGQADYEVLLRIGATLWRLKS
ncbi:MULTISPECIES: hypothetical protein [unclassified Variovorax]|uniref:hypothetical protein n=1 Tax=unclassified Variovorax TaxID=663243 RepID=UPI0013179C0B|nr:MULTISPECIES: hypothetical protein [unclassified Variovorax]VTU15990.1 hypothetical protein SRS16CHR_01660 [Variovorax sp. SRS16]VTU24193.1 hypothetical protein E5CHR_01743 [Variovorax sp. PBL-E5]